MVLVYHAAEHLTAAHRGIKRHDDRLVMIRWPLLPGLVRPVPVEVTGVAPQHCPQMAFAVDEHPVRALSSYADRLPTAREVVADGYTFAEHLLTSQRKFADELIGETSPMVPHRAAPKAIAATKAAAPGKAA